MASVTWTPLVPHPPTAEFPTYQDGYDSLGNQYRHVFDFTRGLGYEAIYCSSTTKGGIEVADLASFTVTQLPSYNSMYAGTPYGNTPGVPPSQVAEVAAGNGTNVYLSMPGPNGNSSNVKNRLARVDPATWKGPGEFYLNATPTGCIYTARHGIVNRIGSADIVAYSGSASFQLQVFNGASVTLIGTSTAALRWPGSRSCTLPGASSGGTCDFWIVNFSTTAGVAPVGAIDLWKIAVAPNGPVVATWTGTVDGLAIWPGVASVAVQRADYDATHDSLILWVGGGSDLISSQSAPATVASVKQDGSIVWTYALTRRAQPSLGSALLNGTTLGVLHDGKTLVTLDTASGAVVQTFDIALPSGVATADESYYSAYAVYSGIHSASLYSFNLAVADWTLVAPLPPRAATPKLGLLRQPLLHFIGAPA